MTLPALDGLKRSILSMQVKLAECRRSLQVDFPWYPYDTLANLQHLEPILTPELMRLFGPGRRLADIGTADGDFAFFLESVGNRCDVYDNPPTNMNGMRGIHALKTALGSNIGVNALDLDQQFTIGGRYDAVFFLGILYHLKNPFYVLERLAAVSSHLFLSTRVARRFTPTGEDVSGLAASYLVGPTELNGDATNFWIFSETGLRRLIDRTGWDVLGFRTLGDTVGSLPNSNEHDERAFAILGSRLV